MFELANVKGVIVAFRYPAYLAGINPLGYHCHFITADRRAGGHLLDCRVEGATVAVDALSNFFLRLPDNQEFLKSDLTGNRRHELEKVEKVGSLVIIIMVCEAPLPLMGRETHPTFL